jgi:hypothetical protein
MNTRVINDPARNDSRTLHSPAERVSAAASQAHRSRSNGAEAVQSETPSTAALFPADVSNQLESRWMQIQTGFVDTPRESVQRADELVSDAIKRLADSFAQERANLEAQWSRDGDVSTEDLRVALQRYRSFFQRLLHI